MNPLISIVIPCFNVEKYLGKCLKSCINQSYQNIEIICVDDVSNDNTRAILKSFKSKDFRIKVYFNEHNMGVDKTRDIGVSYVKGEYFIFLDSDDYLRSNAVLELTKHLKSDVDCVIAGYKCLWHHLLIKQRNLRSASFNEKQVISAFMQNQAVNNYCWNKLYKTTKYRQSRENIKTLFIEDISAVFRYFVNSKKTVVIKKYLWIYRKRVGSITSSMSMDVAHEIYKAFQYQEQEINKLYPDLNFNNSYNYARTNFLLLFNMFKMTRKQFKETSLFAFNPKYLPFYLLIFHEVLYFILKLRFLYFNTAKYLIK